MNYKELFRLAVLLVSSPAKAWEEISHEKDRRSVFVTFVYPMIGLCALSVFIGAFINDWGQQQIFQIAMRKCCAVVVALFGGYFLASYAINKVGVALFRLKDDIRLSQQFAGYALIVMFFSYIIWGILPDFFILYAIFQFYVLYIVWEGAKSLIQLNEKDRMSYTLIVSLFLILCPTLIGFIFNKLTVILN